VRESGIAYHKSKIITSTASKGPPKKSIREGKGERPGTTSRLLPLDSRVRGDSQANQLERAIAHRYLIFKSKCISGEGRDEFFPSHQLERALAKAVRARTIAARQSPPGKL